MSVFVTLVVLQKPHFETSSKRWNKEYQQKVGPPPGIYPKPPVHAGKLWETGLQFQTHRDVYHCLPFWSGQFLNCHNLVALCQLMPCWTCVWYVKPLPHEATIEAPWTICTTVFDWFMSSWMDYSIIYGCRLSLFWGALSLYTGASQKLKPYQQYEIPSILFNWNFLHIFAWSLLGSCETLKNWPDVASTGWIVVLPGHRWTLGNALVRLGRPHQALKQPPF